MTLRYILIDAENTSETPSPNFSDPNTLKKHLLLQRGEAGIAEGVLIETPDGAFFFDDCEQLYKFLDIVAP